MRSATYRMNSVAIGEVPPDALTQLSSQFPDKFEDS